MTIRDQARAMREGGATLKKIAQDLGIAESTASVMCAGMGEYRKGKLYGPRDPIVDFDGKDWRAEPSRPSRRCTSAGIPANGRDSPPKR